MREYNIYIDYRYTETEQTFSLRHIGMAATTIAYNFLGYKTASMKIKNQSCDDILCHNRTISRTAGIKRDCYEILHKIPCRSVPIASSIVTNSIGPTTCRIMDT